MARLFRTPERPSVAGAVALYGLLTAVMLILGYIERLFPLVSAIPGIRLGLANVALLYALYLLGAKAAWTLLVVKVLLGGFLFSGVTGAMYAAGGGVCAMCAMCAAKRLRDIHVPGVSVCGALFHIGGQILVSRMLLGSWAALVQAPFLVAAAAGTGLLTGMAAATVLRVLPQKSQR